MSIFARLSEISRTRKYELFKKVLKPTKEMKILDVGAEINPTDEHNLQLIDIYPWKNNVSAINISPKIISHIEEHYPEVDAWIGDACALHWEDKYFDIVYSNAVIEHLGSFERQKKMANEIMRVGRSWFVTTPNRWFPFEFHMRLPLVTWIPCKGYFCIGSIISYNHVKRKYTFGNKFGNKYDEGLRLMSYQEVKRCFPCSKVIKQRVTVMAETLIAIGGDILNKFAF